MNDEFYARIDGELGVETRNNKKLLDGRGEVVRRYDQTRSMATFPRRIIVHSRNRTIGEYASAASFTIDFEQPLVGVCYLEMVSVNLPNATVAPQDRLILIANGLVKSNGFQGCDGPKLSCYEVAKGTNDSGLEVDADRYALARINYDSDASNQFWEAPRNHPLSYFEKPTNMSRIQLSVIDNSGAAYAFPAEEEWSCELLAYCTA